MKALTFFCLMLVAAAALGGCHKKDDVAADTAAGGIDWSPHPHGRYIGVGVYNPQDAWTKLADVQQPGGPAKTANDQTIIVVIDSSTGETRACGDLSGYCVGMNPWKTALTGAQKAPVVMSAPAAPEAKTGASQGHAATAAPTVRP